MKSFFFSLTISWPFIGCCGGGPCSDVGDEHRHGSADFFFSDMGHLGSSPRNRKVKNEDEDTLEAFLAVG